VNRRRWSRAIVPFLTALDRSVLAAPMLQYDTSLLEHQAEAAKFLAEGGRRCHQRIDVGEGRPEVDDAGLQCRFGIAKQRDLATD
jgi:hypothetical protein